MTDMTDMSDTTDAAEERVGRKLGEFAMALPQDEREALARLILALEPGLEPEVSGYAGSGGGTLTQIVKTLEGAANVAMEVQRQQAQEAQNRALAVSKMLGAMNEIQMQTIRNMPL